MYNIFNLPCWEEILLSIHTFINQDFISNKMNGVTSYQYFMCIKPGINELYDLNKEAYQTQLNQIYAYLQSYQETCIEFLEEHKEVDSLEITCQYNNNRGYYLYIKEKPSTLPKYLFPSFLEEIVYSFNALMISEEYDAQQRRFWL